MSTLITIDLDALAANYRYCREHVAPADCAAVVKADGYGLGIRHVARALRHAGCRRFFTATHREAIGLRSLLRDAVIYVLEGVQKRSVQALRDHDLVPVLISAPQAGIWADRARREGRRLPAVVDIDTGMTRLGFSGRELREFAEGDDAGQFDLQYVMTHFASAEEPGAALAREQLERFDSLRRLLPDSPTCIGNSAGSLLGPEFAGDLARVGIALFGGNPYPEDHAMPLRAVLRVQSRILQLRDIDEETTVGYGATYSAKPGTRIATVGIGYADGYPWSLGNRGVAAVNGHRVPVIGRVSMDLITLDVTGVPDELIQPGSLVDLIGPDITLEEVAELAGTIPYEILTRLGQRASRTFLGGPPEDLADN